MTHTLHRRGDRDDLLQDYPMLAHVAMGYNDKGAGDRLRKIADIMLKYTDLNFGDPPANRYSASVEQVYDGLDKVVHCVFRDKESLTACMKELKELDAGISVIVSGCFDAVEECCDKAGIKWHLQEQSLGIHGATDKLPAEPYLEILTMCGHAMVAKNQVDHLIGRINKGKISFEQAGQELAKPCVCGIFNPERAARLLKGMAAAGCGEKPSQSQKEINK